MTRVVLIFPGSVELASFVLLVRVKGIVVDSRDYSLTGNLSLDQILRAKKEFGARLQRVKKRR